jgi:hypothetical protein
MVHVTGLFSIGLHAKRYIMDAYLIHAILEKIFYFFLNLDITNYSLEVYSVIVAPD